MIVEAMENNSRYRSPRSAKPEIEPVHLQKRIEKFENYMKKIMEFDITQRIGKEEGGATGREYGQLLLAGLGPLGSTYEQKLQNLQNILSGSQTGGTSEQLFSALTVAKMMNKFLYDMNQRKAGNAFEVFMAVLMGGSIEETYGPSDTGDRKEDFDIVDLTAPASNGRERYSLKFVSGKAISFKGSLFNMMNEILKNGYVNYVFCMKNNPKDRTSVSLTFKTFTIDKAKFREINIGFLRQYGLLEKYDAGKPVKAEDFPKAGFGLMKSYDTSLNLFDVKTVATLEVGMDNISNLLKTSVTGYSKILMDSLDNLNQTAENLTKFIYADDIISGEKASDSAGKLKASLETAITTRKQGVN